MKSVLFLCTGNSCRSQMAEGFLRKLGNLDFEVYSAGTDPKPIHPLAIKVMQEKGIDISRQRSKSLMEYLGKKRFDLVVSVCSQADKACPAIFPNSQERQHWPFEDPAASQGSEQAVLEKFREVRDAIELKIMDWLQLRVK